MPRLRVVANTGPEVSVTLDIYKDPETGVSTTTRRMLERKLHRKLAAPVRAFIALAQEQAMHLLPMSGQALPAEILICLRGPQDKMHSLALKQVEHAPHRHSWRFIADALLVWVCLRTDCTQLRLVLRRLTIRQTRSDVFYINIHLPQRGQVQETTHEDDASSQRPAGASGCAANQS